MTFKVAKSFPFTLLAILLVAYPTIAFSQVKILEQRVILENLQIPWEIAFLPDQTMLITERPGTVMIYRSASNQKRVTIPSTAHIGEGGLLGMAIHPKYIQNKWIYLYRTIKQNNQYYNQVVRYRFENMQFSQENILLANIPGHQYHNGGRIAFGPDGYLYVTTGDAGVPEYSQQINNLAGKILRMTDQGQIPKDNSYNNYVYSYGHRNPQGLAWDDKQQLWATEHGPSGWGSGYDELNVIHKGKNYGWPHFKGDESHPNTVQPIIHSGADETWAPAGLVFVNNSFLFAGLRGRTLYEYNNKNANNTLVRHLVSAYGRLRAVVKGPNNKVYISTSNRDRRTIPGFGDDKIIELRLSPN